MSDKLLEFSSELTNITWELSHLANRAFDAQNTAAKHLQEIIDIVLQETPGISRHPNIMGKLRNDEFLANRYFTTILGAIDDEAMKHPASPFQLSPALIEAVVEPIKEKPLSKNEIVEFMNTQKDLDGDAQLDFNKLF